MFFIFCQGCTRSWGGSARGERGFGALPIPLRIFVDHVTIFNSSHMQYLSWSTLWRKIGNGWKLLLTIVISIPSTIDIFKISKKKKQKNVLNIFKLTINTPERWFYCELWTYFALYFTVNNAEFEQINVCWACEMLADNKVIFGNSEKQIVLWAARMCWAICFIFIHPT